VPGRGMGRDCDRAELRRPHTVWMPASSIPPVQVAQPPQGPHRYPREPPLEGTSAVPVDLRRHPKVKQGKLQSQEKPG